MVTRITEILQSNKQFEKKHNMFYYFISILIKSQYVNMLKYVRASFLLIYDSFQFSLTDLAVITTKTNSKI
jgi:hypothetical protein